MATPWQIDFLRPFDFTNIVGQSHGMPGSLKEMPSFGEDNFISAREHWNAFTKHKITLVVFHWMFYLNVSLCH